MKDPRLVKARAALEAAQDRYSELAAVYRQAQQAYARSRSKRNREALIAASEDLEAACPSAELFDEIERLEELVEREQIEAAEAAERALQFEMAI